MEESEEDRDPVLAGYMTFLKKALKTLPNGLRAQVKARAGADVISSPTTSTAAAAAVAADGKGVAGVGTPHTTASTKALSAVAVVAGQLVGGMWGAGRALRGRDREEVAGAAGGPGTARAAEAAGGRGLVRELVERCLFSLPHERGNAGGGEGGTLCEGEKIDDGDDDDGVRSFVVCPHPFFFICSARLAVLCTPPAVVVVRRRWYRLDFAVHLQHLVLTWWASLCWSCAVRWCAEYLSRSFTTLAQIRIYPYAGNAFGVQVSRFEAVVFVGGSHGSCAPPLRSSGRVHV